MYTKSPPAHCVYHLPAVHTIIGKPRHIGKYLQQQRRGQNKAEARMNVLSRFGPWGQALTRTAVSVFLVC
jgi:hypothetical protein